MTPLISILIPAFNRPDYLRRSLDQLAIQQFSSFEVIITDDSTTDAVEEFVQVQSYAFPIQYFRNRPALGTPRNWVAGMKLARGEWIKILHDDDWLTGPDSLHHFAQFVCSDIDLIFGGYEAVYELTGVRKDRRISPRQFTSILKEPHRLFASNLLGPPSVLLYRRCVLEGFDPDLKWIVDWEGYIRMLEKHRATYIPRVLVSMSYNPSQVTQSCFGNPLVEIPETLMYYQKHGDKTRSSWRTYDAWWRMIRNLSIRSTDQLRQYANGLTVPPFLDRLINHQRYLPLCWWRIGPISKIGMYISYKLNR